MSSNNMIFNTLLLLAVVTAQPPQQQQQQGESACSWSYYQQCGWQNTNGVRTATSDSFVTFGVTSSQPSDVYSATVSFFNSPYSPSSSNNNNNNKPRSEYEVISTGTQVYPTNINITKSNTFTYTSYGYYRLGYNLTFGEGSGYCTDKTFGVEGYIYFDESSCEFGVLTEEETTTAAATASTAAAAATEATSVEGIADAAPVAIGESEGAAGGNEETTTTSNTDNTNNNAATPLLYNNPQGNNFFCGYSFDTVSSSCLQSKPCVNGVGVGVCGDTEGCFKVDMCVLEYEVAGRVIVDTATTTTVATTMATTTTTGATATSSSTTSQPVSTTTATTTTTTSASSSEAAIAPSPSSSTTSSTTSSAASANDTSSTSTSTSAPNNNEEVLVEYDEEYPWPPSADEPSSSSEAATNSNNEMNFANSGDYSSADTLHCYCFRVMMIMMIGFGCVVFSVS